jgi:hypothetical protein
MVKETYKSILQDKLMATIDYDDMNPAKAIFQHDNDPKHTASVVCEWLDQQLFEVLIWLAQLPDLNPIECWKRAIRLQLLWSWTEL